MNTSSHFSSKTSALVLWSVLVASTLIAGVSLAQSLTIPTTLSNSIITIKEIILSTNGTNKTLSELGSTIQLDGAQGNITTKASLWAGGKVNVGGNLTVSGGVYLKADEFAQAGCASATGCILRVTADGKVTTTSTVNPWIATGDDAGGLNTEIFKRNPANPKDTYYATATGDAAVAGKNTAAWQQYLRVWVLDTTSQQWPNKDDTAMVVAGSSEIRGDLLIRKANGTQFGNEGNNKDKLDLTTSTYTELDTRIKDGKVEMEAKQKTGPLPQHTSLANLDISAATTRFSAGSTSTSVGINTTATQTPAANLHVAGSNDTFLVGDGKGRCVSDNLDKNTNVCYATQCSTSNECLIHGKAVCTADTNIVWGSSCGMSNTTLFADSGIGRVGINTKFPQQSLDVIGRASISNNLIIGHPSGFNPGTDKLAVNGSTRANAYYYNSDRRYKSDIEALTSPLANLLRISGYSYLNKLSQKKDIGVIAQEVEAVYPELVQTDADGYKSVQYGNLVAPIIEAIRELATKIDNLFTLYVSQQAKIDTLEARLLKLESQVK